MSTNLLSSDAQSPGALVAALTANQEAQSPSQLPIPLETTSAVLSQELHPFLQTPQSALFPTPISPLGDYPSWPDSKSPGSALNAVKATGPNAFPPVVPKTEG